MNPLHSMYRAALHAHIAALDAARTDGGREAIPLIRRIAHTLRGSGGTYGFPHISAAAQAVEEADDASVTRLVVELTKPFDPTALMAELNRIIGADEQRR